MPRSGLRAPARAAARAAAVVAATVAPVAVVSVSPTAPTVHAATVPAGFVDQLVATASSPTAVESLPDGRLVVLEQGGRVRAGQPGQPLATVLDVPNVCVGGERGLLGFTHDPAYLTNRRVYVFYTRQAPEAPGGCVNRVSRFDMPSAIDPASEVVLLDNISSVNGNHNGGDLDVGSDGHLYVATGDAGRDPRGDSGGAGANDAAQDLSILNGKILRLTLDGAPAPTNPLLGPGTEPCAFRGATAATPTTSCQEIFAWGLRNPYRIAFDPNGGGDRFMINDVGQAAREEVNAGGIGRNYGWNTCEGPCVPGTGAGFTDPVASYPRTVGTVITGGAFVPNGFWPAGLDGSYFYADAGSGRIFRMAADGSVDHGVPWATGAGGIADMVFALDQTGRLALYYTLNSSGQLRSITWSATTPSPTPSDLALVATAPTRVHDTRTGVGVTAGVIRAGTTRLVDAEPPSPDVRAALVNLTVTGNAGWGFLEAWSPRSLRPATSVINVVRPVEDVANASVVTLDAEGRFVVHATTATHLVVDVLGWFVPTAGAAVGPGRFVPVEPGRLVDTRRPAGTPLDSGATNAYARSGTRVDVTAPGQLAVPSDGTAGAAVVVLTGLGEQASRSGYVTAHAQGGAAPDASNVNTNGDGDIRANLALVPAGTFSLELVRVDDVLVDVVGYVTSAAAAPSRSGLFSAVSPVRVFDERSPSTPPISSGGTVTLDHSDAVPGAPTAGAVLQNLTVTDTGGFGFVTAWPGTGTRREVSNVNATAADQTRAALAVTPYGPGGQVSYYVFGESSLLVDVFGTFSR